MPVRFLFLLLGPSSANMDYHEIGRLPSPPSCPTRSAAQGPHLHLSPGAQLAPGPGLHPVGLTPLGLFLVVHLHRCHLKDS